MSPEVLANGLLALFQDGKPLSENLAEQVTQMTAVIWRILTIETGDAEHPGKIADYVGDTDFDVYVKLGRDGCSYVIEATSRFHS
jgi:hypothetical protein